MAQQCVSTHGIGSRHSRDGAITIMIMILRPSLEEEVNEEVDGECGYDVGMLVRCGSMAIYVTLGSMAILKMLCYPSLIIFRGICWSYGFADGKNYNREHHHHQSWDNTLGSGYMVFGCNELDYKVCMALNFPLLSQRLPLHWLPYCNFQKNWQKISQPLRSLLV